MFKKKKFKNVFEGVDFSKKELNNKEIEIISNYIKEKYKNAKFVNQLAVFNGQGSKESPIVGKEIKSFTYNGFQSLMIGDCGVWSHFSDKFAEIVK